MSAPLGPPQGSGRAPRDSSGHPRRRRLRPGRLAGVRLPVTILSCLGLAAGAAACGSSASSSSTTSHASSSAAATSATASSSTATATTSAAAASGATCDQLAGSSTPSLKIAAVPKLATLESKALRSLHSAFRFSGQTCVATTSPPQIVTLSGVASLHPTLVVDGHENLAGHALEVRFIGSKIYIYLAEIAARDGGKPWLVADLKRLSSASGLNFGQLLGEVRQLSPGGSSPLLKASRAFVPKGRATINGQAVYVYAANFTPSALTKLGLPGQLGRQTAAKLRQLGATRESVVSYLTPQAVALRTVAAIFKGSKLLTLSVNSSSRLPHAITVSPPPAAKTIDYSKVAGG
jgi:hypothetical protein